MKTFTASYAVNHPDTVEAAALRYRDVQITSDDGVSVVVTVEPRPGKRTTPHLFSMRGKIRTPAVAAERAEWQEFIDCHYPGGENTVGQITGSFAWWSIKDIATEVQEIARQSS